MRVKKVWLPWWEWECCKNGLYSTSPPEGKTAEDCREEYRMFLADIPRFKAAMERVSEEWPNSCLHFLTNEGINRIAWLGWSAMCIETSVSSSFCGGYAMLTINQKRAANKAAAIFLERWLNEHARKNRAIHKAMDGPRVCGRHTGRGSGLLAEAESCAVVQGDLFCDSAKRSPA